MRIPKSCGCADAYGDVCGQVDYRSGKEEVFLCPECTVADLQQQLTAALAERDEARERVKSYEKEANDTLAFYAEKGRVIVTHDGNAIQRLGASAEIAICKAEQERDRLAAQLDTAWQQGAEAFREAAIKEAEQYQVQVCRSSYDDTRDSIATAIADAIRAFPVPERKEG